MIYPQGYPKSMSHPQYAPATMAPDNTGNITGAPLRFPPVMADNEGHEDELRSRGYLPAGESQAMTKHLEYPLMLAHPGHVEAVPDQIQAVAENGAIKTFTIRGVAEVLPNVLVNDPHEEAEWEEKGYRRPGHSDSAAFDKASTAPGMPGAEWPKWVGGVLMQDPDNPAPDPKLYPMYITSPNGEPMVVSSRAEHDRLCGPLDGPPVVMVAPEDAEMAEFRAWKAAQKADAQKPDELAELRARAVALGIWHDKRWGAGKLREAISAAEKDDAERAA